MVLEQIWFKKFILTKFMFPEHIVPRISCYWTCYRLLFLLKFSIHLRDLMS